LKNIIKWHTIPGDTYNDGKWQYARSLLSGKYDKDMTKDIVSDEIVNVIIKALHYKHLISTLYWWVRYGFKCNKMYWYKNQ
jgi:hypothetical protein